MSHEHFSRDDFNGLGKRPFKRATFDDTWNDQTGWQRVDDTTVLERKRLRAAQSNHMYIDYIYDFMSQVLMISFVKDRSADEPPTVNILPFSQIEGQEAIVLAHEALTKLGGHPPALETIIRPSFSIGRDINALQPPTFKKNDNAPKP